MRRAYGREYGAAIARLRHEHGLKQTDIQGISERQLRRIERSGDVSVQNLNVLADAHGMKLDRYLHAIAESLVPPLLQKTLFLVKFSPRDFTSGRPLSAAYRFLVTTRLLRNFSAASNTR